MNTYKPKPGRPSTGRTVSYRLRLRPDMHNKLLEVKAARGGSLVDLIERAIELYIKNSRHEHPKGDVA